MKEFGLQMFSVRDTMDTAENIRMTFRRLREMGYTQAQTAGCNIPYEEYGKIAAEEGIAIVGTHDSFQVMEEDFDLALQNHRALNTTNMGIGSYHADDLAGWQNFVRRANAVAEKCAKAGMKFTYHNHSHEFVRLENGQTAMEVLVEGLNPETTSFVLDTFWVQHGGGDVRGWIQRLAGRIDILHLKDMMRLPHFDEKRGYQLFTEVGNGNMDWPSILETAEACGIKYYIVEQDICPGDPFESMAKSAAFLKQFI